MAVPMPRPTPATGSTGPTGKRTRRKPATETPEPDQIRGNGGTRGDGSDTPPASRPAAPTSRPARKGSMESRLEEFLAAATLPFAVAGDDYSAQIIALRSPALAKSLADLARENAAVKRILDRIMEGSAWGAVAIASLAIIIPICQHHNLIPGNDPFAAIMPAPQGPRKMSWGSGGSTPTPDGSAMGAPGPGSGGDRPPIREAAPPPDPDAEFKPQVPGSPPGVVTVAASPANHPS